MFISLKKKKVKMIKIHLVAKCAAAAFSKFSLKFQR